MAWGTQNRNITIDTGNQIDQSERDHLPDYTESRGSSYEAKGKRSAAWPWQPLVVIVVAGLGIVGYLTWRFIEFLTEASFATSWLDVYLIGALKVALFFSPIAAIAIGLYWLWSKAQQSRIVRLANNHPVSVSDIEGGWQRPMAREFGAWTLGEFYGTNREWARHSGYRSLNQLSVAGGTPSQFIEAEPVEEGTLLPAPADIASALAVIPKTVRFSSIWQDQAGRTLIPLGVDQTGNTRWLDIKREVLHAGIWGGSGAGKENLFEGWFARLTSLNSPEQMQFVVLDGKGHWMKPQLANLEHMWMRPAGGIGDEGNQAIQTALKCIQNEAKRRGQLVFGADCDTLEQYITKTGDQIPLLVVFISDVIGSVTGEIDKLLVDLVSKARALGIRVIVSMQTPTKQNTQWRSNLSTVFCGQIQGRSNDEPALGIAERDILYPPSQLPNPNVRPGVFVVRSGNEQMLVQAPLVDRAFLDQHLASLPLRATRYVKDAEIIENGQNPRSATRSAAMPMSDEQRDNLVRLLRRKGQTQDAIRTALTGAGVQIAQKRLVELCQEVDAQIEVKG